MRGERKEQRAEEGTKGIRPKLGLKAKLLGVLLPIVVCVVAVIVTMVYTSTERIVLAKSEEVLKSSTDSVKQQVSGWMDEIAASLDAKRDALEYFAMEDDEILKFVRHTAGQNEAFPTGIYFAKTDGKLIHPSFEPEPGFNVFEREWYQDGIDTDGLAFGAVYLDAESQSYVVSVSGAVKDAAGTTQGVVAADIYLDSISGIVQQVRLEETGGAFLVEGATNTIIGHQDAQLVGTRLDEEGGMYAQISEKIAGGEYGLGTAADESGKKMYIDIEQIPDCSWMIVSYVPYHEILSELSQLTKVVVLVACAGCVILIILMERLIHMIAKPVKTLSGTMAAMTDGDFTVAVNVKTSDEIGLMADGVKRFISVMRELIRQIGGVSARLNSQAEGSAAISGELSDASKLQADSMEELNRTVNELTQSITEVAEMANSLSALVGAATEIGSAADVKMKQAVEASGRGQKDMDKIQFSMGDISRKMAELEKCAFTMDGSVEKINSIVELIGEIAEETNLLSLNASIEAARAGDAGKGFAVVADQIGKLAGTSKSAVDDIAALTGEISEIVHSTVAMTKENAKMISDSTEIVAETGATFKEIYESVGETSESVGGMIEKVKDVSRIAVDVAGITAEQSAASEEILATAESMRENAVKVFEHSRNVAEDAKELKENAGVMKENIDKFTV